jgi:YgiT-type zinc finger domain-containing protein
MNQTRPDHNRCPVCHLGTFEHVTVDHLCLIGGTPVLVTEMPAWVCDTCAEVALDEAVVKAVERLWDDPPTPVRLLQTPVFEFDQISAADQMLDHPSPQG